MPQLIGTAHACEGDFFFLGKRECLWLLFNKPSVVFDPYRRCSSYQDFTLISASTESVDFPKSPSDELSPSQKHKHVSRTLSEPSHLGGRVGRSHSEQRGRRNIHHRNRRLVKRMTNHPLQSKRSLLSIFIFWFFHSPSNRTPSPTVSSRRAAGPNMEEDSPPDENTAMPTEISGAISLTSRGQLGSRPHTPMGRVDIRPRDDPVIVQQTLYYAPASPKPEYKSAPTTPVTERWQTKVRTYFLEVWKTQKLNQVFLLLLCLATLYGSTTVS